MSIVEDQVKYSRSLGNQAALLRGKQNERSRNIEWIGSVFFVVRKPGIINWGEEFQGNVL